MWGRSKPRPKQRRRGPCRRSWADWQLQAVLCWSSRERKSHSPFVEGERHGKERSISRKARGTAQGVGSRDREIKGEGGQSQGGCQDQILRGHGRVANQASHSRAETARAARGKR